MDQSDSRHAAGFGGRIHIFAGADLMGDSPGAATADTVDLGGATADLCREFTGANPVRPHMLHFNREGTHAVLSFWQSGHVAILDAASRTPLACLRMPPGEDGIRQAYDAVPAPDGSYVLVSNHDGKRLERIQTDYPSHSFAHDPGAALDLATGTTPAGRPREADGLRPDAAPLCPFIDGESRHAWVTLRGGGLFVVDPRSTPMAVVAEYDRATVKGSGCGGAEAGGWMFIGSGAAPGTYVVGGFPVEHDHGSEVYRFPLMGYGEADGANTPAAELAFTADGDRDSRGMAAVGDGEFIWVLDRHADLIEVLDADDGSRVSTIPLAGMLATRPAPDQLDVAPSGDRAFVTFRGPTPIFGDPHNAHGSTPALGIVDVTRGGRGGELVGLIPFTNPFIDREMADPHAVRVRRLPAPRRGGDIP